MKRIPSISVVLFLGIFYSRIMGLQLFLGGRDS